MTFPSDAQTLHSELVGPTTVTLVSGTSIKYVLGVSMQQSGTASQTSVSCGSSVIAINYGKDFAFNPMIYRCADAVIASKTGQDSSSVILTYVPRDVALEPALVASVSADFAPVIRVAMHDLSYVTWMGSVMTMISLGLITFLLFMKRK